MNNHDITPATAIAARKELGLSQAMVAREIGLNRSYLSDFEGGKRILEDRWLEALFSFFLAEGWLPADTEPEVVGTEVAQQSEDSSATNFFACADGFIIAKPAIDEEVESLLDELYDNNERIRGEKQRLLPRGFLGGLDEADAVETCLPALAMMARQYEITQQLHGHHEKPRSDLDPSVKGSVQTVGDYLAILVAAVATEQPEVD
ncbi:MAG TPA: hypothetical protein DIW43_14450 [Spongiibacteraceae bacterium]|nr:hypothetical protein [Spongiibacteraceae bacterium]HCS28659.1 hypothetical protein [Spongiibacteraceae bacterium]|tara:strand:+ start:223 stop:837 length:615 start_codon:yes stop_codon:yes gene_type:complete